MNLQGIVLISGPTASGKSDFALALAKQVGGEIVNIDSVQFYKDFIIGAAHPSSYHLSQIPHHLYQVVSPEVLHNVAELTSMVHEVCKNVFLRGKVPIVVGSSGMYISALFTGISELPKSSEGIRAELESLSNHELFTKLKMVDPERADVLASSDRYRVIRSLELQQISGKSYNELIAENKPIPLCTGLVFVMWPNRDVLYQNINARSEIMIEDGLIRETQYLQERYNNQSLLFKSLGYKQSCKFLCGEYLESEVSKMIALETRHYAKRQITFWNNEPKKRQWKLTTCYQSTIKQELVERCVDDVQTYFTNGDFSSPPSVAYIRQI
jgi:tRNA dimethylallyltransferase